jgi:uncharacterized membrane protein YkoI
MILGVTNLGIKLPAAAASKPLKPASDISAAEPAASSSGSTAEEADERLAEITLKVKETLGISNEYTNFYGNLTKNEYATRWQLNWSGNNGSLNVQADENGKVYSMNLYDNNQSYDYKYYYRPHYDPVFPKVTKAEAVKAAEAFFKKVLDENEGFEISKYIESPENVSSYNFSGYLTVNGLRTDSWLNVNVRTSDLTVTYFYRDDGNYYISGGYPTIDTSLTPEAALKLYKPTYTAKAEYTIIGDSKQAKLVYFVSQNGNYVVDAKKGELVRFEDYIVYDKGYGMATAEAAADSSYSGAYLTDTELKGIEHLDGMLTDTELDAIIRAEPAFGLTSEYELKSVNYNVSAPDKGIVPRPLDGAVVSTDVVSAQESASADEEQADVTASVSYTLKITDYAAFGISDEEWAELTKNGYTPQVNKNFTLDAKTGEIDSCYTDYYGFKWKDKKTSEPKISKTAETFLSKRFSAWFGKTGVYNSYANNWNVETYSFTYCQSVNGYFYPGNSINVSVNAYTGNVDSFSCWWDDTVTFEPVTSVVGEEAAVEAYMSAYKTQLQYSRLPVKTESAEYSYPTVYKMLLAYTISSKDNDRYIHYIDAVTGEVVYYDWYNEYLTVSYDDIAGSYARDEILKLAEYGVGYYAYSFEPEKKLTELDMILFLISANGYKYEYDKINEETISQIYSTAYDLDILDKGQKEPDKAITRTDIVRSLVSMAGHSDVAELEGIYKCGFTDDGEIDSKDYGYVAIAKGLGLVTGDPSGAFRPYDIITRQELAHMMYKYMSR